MLNIDRSVRGISIILWVLFHSTKLFLQLNQALLSSVIPRNVLSLTAWPCHFNWLNITKSAEPETELVRMQFRSHYSAIRMPQTVTISCLIHSVACLTTGPYALPKRVLHRMRSSSSSFNFHSPLFSLRSSISCSRHAPRLPFTFILPSIFPSVLVLEGSSYARYDQSS